MPKKWRIKKYDGMDLLGEWSVSGRLSEKEICSMLRRLVSRNLSDDEIIGSSLRKNDSGYLPLLEQVGRGNPICFGDGIHYTAHWE